MGRTATRGRRRAPPHLPADVTLGGIKFTYLSAPLERADYLPRLSPAEREVARLAASGLSNQEIGRLRTVSERTVANQLASAFRKLGVGSRVELLALLARSSVPDEWY